jgi:hypothetical protein
VRKWLVGRGIKRTGLPAPREVARVEPDNGQPTAATLQFIPVELAPGAPACGQTSAAEAPAIHIDLTRAGTRLSVRWPSTQAASCAAWLHELAAAALKE